MTIAYPSAARDALELEAAMAAVREADLRLTAARRLLLEVLWEAREPLAAEELVDRLDGRSDAGRFTGTWRRSSGSAWSATFTSGTGRGSMLAALSVHTSTCSASHVARTWRWTRRSSTRCAS